MKLRKSDDEKFLHGGRGHFCLPPRFFMIILFNKKNLFHINLNLSQALY